MWFQNTARVEGIKDIKHVFTDRYLPFKKYDVLVFYLFLDVFSLSFSRKLGQTIEWSGKKTKKNKKRNRWVFIGGLNVFDSDLDSELENKNIFLENYVETFSRK